MNRTITETVEFMRFHANLPLSFWAEAVSTAVYLRNRSPTSILKDITLFEAWFKIKPDVSNLNVFGCKAFVHVPDQQRKNWTKCRFHVYLLDIPTIAKGINCSI